MKRFLMAVAACLALVAIAPKAHAQGGGQGGRGRMMEMLFKDVNLTEVQKTKVDSIVKHYREQMPQRTEGSPPDSASIAKRREVMTKQNTDLRKLLNADQQKVFDANVAEMNSKMGKRGQGK